MLHQPVNSAEFTALYGHNLINEDRSIKATFKHGGNYEERFENSICSLSISVGQPAHEGTKFAATIDAVNTNFKECIIMVGDS